MIAAVILAAGGSTRLGRPKPLLRYRGRSLVRRTVEAARRGGCAPIVVVLGSSAEAVRKEIADLSVDAAVNDDWKRGLGESVRTGIDALVTRGEEVRGVLLLPCDLPRLTAEIVGRIVAAAGAPSTRVVACEYAGTLGVPALFPRDWFERLRDLRGDRGAKALLLAHARDVVRVAWPDGALDVDEQDDLGVLGGDTPD